MSGGTVFVTKEQVRTWLVERANQIVGQACVSGNCPLARCVNSLLGISGAQVGMNQITVGQLTQRADWINDFTHAVDRLPYGASLAGVTALVMLGE